MFWYERCGNHQRTAEADRRREWWTLRQILLEIASQNEDVALCNQAALEGAVMFDRMEDNDARPRSRRDALAQRLNV